jgi:hypothetical protein
MYVYQFEGKILCDRCFEKLSKRKPRRTDVIDGNEFYHRFQDRSIRCEGRCGKTFEYPNIFTSTDDSLGE